VFGSKSGFDSLKECFDELEPQIFAVETGLSSDPPMNWRIPFLDHKTIVSGSDSHSLPRIGREATIFNTDLSYQGIMNAIKSRDECFLGTVEFFPEEGRYHYDGHAACQVCFSPEQTKASNNKCPKCGKPLVIGVMARIIELADPQRPEGFKPDWARPFMRMISLDEVIGEALSVGKNSKAVWREYEEAVSRVAPELPLLLDIPENQLRSQLNGPTAEAIMRVRQGKVSLKPGYDGEYGVIKIFEDGEAKKFVSQKTLF
jgi:PHP family Zn ribbon phosphoesterase